MAISEKDLLGASNHRLEELFRSSTAGDVPTGPTEGTGLVCTGTWPARPIAVLVRLLLWQGKVFAADGRSLVNRVTPLDALAIGALVYPGPSLMDDRDCIVIDYSKTSRVFGAVRDEIRQVAPDLFLGVVWFLGRKTCWFALRVPRPDSEPASRPGVTTATRSA
ncbi:hypothetical protein [Streptomyces sp. NPDC046197]|uniref:hypothetical protein n=1 Tax=Streptomyces sp. NPDC046197 TaxID=3154337 RepID=UPI0033E2E5B5